MGRRTTGDHTDEVARRYGIGGCATQPFAGILAPDAALGQRQPAGPHAAVFAANPLYADIAGFHADGQVEYRIDA